MVLSDAVRAFRCAADPVADILGHWRGNTVDVSFFRYELRAFDSVYLVDRIREDLGFVVEIGSVAA